MKPETYLNNKLKPPKKFFEWCESQLPIYEWSNKSEEIRSSNREFGQVIKKRLTKNTKLTLKSKFYSFAIILVTKKRIEIQSYGYWLSVINGEESLSTDLVNFEQFANDTHTQATNVDFYNRPVFGMTNNYFIGGPYTNTRFYKNEWQEKVKEISELQYIDYSQIELERWRLSHLYKYKFEIEFLQKIGATKMVEQLISYKTDMRSLTKKWLKENKHKLKDYKDTFEEFEMDRRIRLRNGKIVDGITEFMDYKDLNCVPKGIGIIRFQNWVIKNKVNMDYYRDYLGLLKDLGIKPNTDNLIAPKDLRKAHDNALKLYNAVVSEMKSEAFENRAKSIKHMEMNIGEYAFVTPKNANELVTEGKMLSHCVGSSRYVENHSASKTTIVFVRDKKYPTTPLYTLEYRSEEVIQIRGKHNESAPELIHRISEKWRKEVVSRTKKRFKNKAIEMVVIA